MLKRQRKDNIPQSVFAIPPELDVSLLLEFVGYAFVLGSCLFLILFSFLNPFVRRSLSLISFLFRRSTSWFESSVTASQLACVVFPTSWFTAPD